MFQSWSLRDWDSDCLWLCAHVAWWLCDHRLTLLCAQDQCIQLLDQVTKWPTLSVLYRYTTYTRKTKRVKTPKSLYSILNSPDSRLKTQDCSTLVLYCTVLCAQMGKTPSGKGCKSVNASDAWNTAMAAVQHCSVRRTVMIAWNLFLDPLLIDFCFSPSYPHQLVNYYNKNPITHN